MELSRSDLIEKIFELKSRKNAVVLAHNYQRSEIFDVADFIGDSLGLCLEALKTKAEIIVFCGVSFMAESAVILNPGKRVFVPFIDAGCAMADMVSAEDLRLFKKKHPGVPVVCYVNSTAEVKAESDICCTSSNAVEIVRSLGVNKVIFVPDKNLASFVASKLPDVEIVAWQGYCPIHHSVTKDYLKQVIKTYPRAKIIAHPESRPEVLAEADYVASTSGMLKVAESVESDDFFVLTECGMTERLQRALPKKRFHGLCTLCFDMKKNTLAALYACLKDEKPEIRVEAKLARRAYRSFEAMFNVSL